ncbi:hypothetical protein QOT17_025203 [Balamuthia mandrillaris]
MIWNLKTSTWEDHDIRNLLKNRHPKANKQLKHSLLSTRHYNHLIRTKYELLPLCNYINNSSKRLYADKYCKICMKNEDIKTYNVLISSLLAQQAKNLDFWKGELPYYLTFHTSPRLALQKAETLQEVGPPKTCQPGQAPVDCQWNECPAASSPMAIIANLISTTLSQHQNLQHANSYTHYTLPTYNMYMLNRRSLATYVPPNTLCPMGIDASKRCRGYYYLGG